MLRIRVLPLVVFIGGLMLAACMPAQSAGPVTVNVRLKEFSIESSVTDFQAGVPYRFIIKNEGQIAHEFMIMPLTMHDTHMPGMPEMSMEERHEAGFLTIPQEQQPAGSTVESNYTFQNVPTDNDIEIVCTLPGHLEAGMHIPVRIE